MGEMKRVALGVTGGIAAYKAAEITRLLQDCGVRVQVVMTRSAQEFVRPLTFAALTGQKVITGLFGPEGAEAVPNVDSAVEHIAVAQEIDRVPGIDAAGHAWIGCRFVARQRVSEAACCRGAVWAYAV